MTRAETRETVRETYESVLRLIDYAIEATDESTSGREALSQLKFALRGTLTEVFVTGRTE